jgi:hypothetical protein
MPPKRATDVARSWVRFAERSETNHGCFARSYAATVVSARPALARAAAFRSLANENMPTFAQMFAESVSKSEIGEKTRKHP